MTFYRHVNWGPKIQRVQENMVTMQWRYVRVTFEKGNLHSHDTHTGQHPSYVRNMKIYDVSTWPTKHKKCPRIYKQI
jgi:hypothetical protein